jgi:WD40 repeat protein
MEVGGSVYAVATLPDRPTQIAIGCENGNLLIQDVSTDAAISSCQAPNALTVLRALDGNSLYAATDEHVLFCDLREGRPPKTILTSPSQIYDLAVWPDLIALATLSHDIVLSDHRTLWKGSSGILPSVCTSLAFVASDLIAAGYVDTALGVWDLRRTQFVSFGAGESGAINPGVVHALAVKGDVVVAARQTGLCVYKSGKLLADEWFEHAAPVQAVAFAECFPGRLCCASGAADGTLMVLDVGRMEPIGCMEVEGEKIQCIASNTQFVVVADTSDNGTIGIFTAEDFEKDD